MRSRLARVASTTLAVRMSSSSSSAPVAVSQLVADAAARVKYEVPVPSDIDVSQAVPPIHISKIAADAGAWGCADRAAEARAGAGPRGSAPVVPGVRTTKIHDFPRRLKSPAAWARE
jgi:hypothetical protein